MNGILKALPLMLLAGCDIMDVDFSAPSAPGYPAAFAGDNYVQLYWDVSPEEDVEGYKVYVSLFPGGPFEQVATTWEPYYFDRHCVNGTTYFYGVTAYDGYDNESEMSVLPAGVVPRPDGYGVMLRDVRVVPDEAGYDFSDFSIVGFDDPYADMYFVNQNDVLLMVVNGGDTDIQDMGYTSSLSDVAVAPSGGWDPDHQVRLVDGHTYIV
jgi:hypothetical protein